ncbi:PpkA [hydrothermal vent metagenome]|uniref:PpkA n=1 Tax=hydrothermal vent metagenome TaxID=652676 RepID=A0A3B1BWY7_9ZZZZ
MQSNRIKQDNPCIAGLVLLLLVASVGFLVVGPAMAEDPLKPLRMEGKKTLYQRVLSRVGAEIYVAPDVQSEANSRVPPFSIFYVYAKQKVGDQEWLQVSPSSRGDISGWIPAKDLVAWKQMLVGVFTKPGNRQPALFFRHRETLVKVLESEIGTGLAEHLRKEAKTGEGESSVIAMEPEIYVDPRQNFYLLPILDHFEADDDFATKVLKVAVVNENIQQSDEKTATGEQGESLSRFKVAMTFVIDTTSSMGPYIDQTRDAIRRICEKTQTTKWRDRFNFALVGFRDSLRAKPDLGYTSKLFTDFKGGGDCSALLADAKEMQESKVSSKDFSEDAFAGINAALTELDWQPYGGRFIILITDASARSGSNRYSSTKLNARELNSKAQSQGIALLSLHLRSPIGNHDHERAELQYKGLSSWPNLPPFYYPLAAGAEQFGAEVEQLADGLISQLGAEVADYMADAKSGKKAQARRSKDIDKLGHAMRLAYLGRTKGTPAPEVFEAWIAERSAQDRRKQALEIRVLLTKDQLSDLQMALRQVIEAGDMTDLAPQDFFNQVRQLLIVAQRDSSELAHAKTLGDPVVLGEYLEGLPYQSALTTIDQESWLAMGAGERQELIDDIEAKIQLYQDIHDNQDLWITLDDGRIKGDAVYPVSLTDLP